MDAVIQHGPEILLDHLFEDIAHWYTLLLAEPRDPLVVARLVSLAARVEPPPRNRREHGDRAHLQTRVDDRRQVAHGLRCRSPAVDVVGAIHDYREFRPRVREVLADARGAVCGSDGRGALAYGDCRPD